MTSHTIGLTNTVQKWSVPRISIESQSCDVRGGRVGGVHLGNCDFVTPIVIFIAFLEQALRAEEPF